jgi:hypothetical protein
MGAAVLGSSGGPASSGVSGTAATSDGSGPSSARLGNTVPAAGSPAAGEPDTGIDVATDGIVTAPDSAFWSGTDAAADVDPSGRLAGGALGLGSLARAGRTAGSAPLGSARSMKDIVAPGTHDGAWVAWTSQVAKAIWSNNEPTNANAMASSGT